MSGHAYRPTPTQEQVLAAVTALESEKRRPVSSGEIAWWVADALGVDTTTVHDAYGLRKVISWGGLQTLLAALFQQGLLVRRTQSEWRYRTRGRVFPTARARCSTWAYATPPVASVLDTGSEQAHDDAAHTWAFQQLAARHPDEFSDLIRQWKADHPLPEDIES